jgi:hypothetical protein
VASGPLFFRGLSFANVSLSILQVSSTSGFENLRTSTRPVLHHPIRLNTTQDSELDAKEYEGGRKKDEERVW